MKTRPRLRTTTKLLAVALTATTGCGTAAVSSGGPADSASGAPNPEVVVALPEAPAPAPTATQESRAEAAAWQAPATPASNAAVQTPPKPRAEDPALIALRDELSVAGPTQALSKKAHFRPLCDKDGYPLVGNVVAGKGPAYSVSDFCADVRH
ncbi:MAG: hypothetical protein R3B70_29995 [Polyangiaceae bacterium]